MTFRAGQKVVCVNDYFGDPRLYPPTNLPIKDRVYTLRDPYSRDGFTWWRLVEVSNEPVTCLDFGTMEPAFAPWHFRPVVEKKTDISIFTAMLKQKQREHEPTI